MSICYRILTRQVRKMSQKIFFPPSDRNKVGILEVLKKHLDKSKSGNVLEISSGTGQHISYFAPNFPLLTFQPSEYDETLFDSIIAYSSEVETKNIKRPIKIDASTDYTTWKLDENNFDYLINVNLIQVSPFKCTLGLFRGAGKLLKSDALMITYGPYAFDGVISPQSNVDFDKELRAKNPEWGIRDLTEVKKISKENGIHFVQLYDLPANNKCVVWQKRS